MQCNLNDIISNGEGLTVEFKSAFNVATIESVVAFANTKGECVLLGISDAGKVTGVEVARESVQQWANEIKSKTEPAIVPDMEVMAFQNKKIVVIQVSEYPVKPISVQGRFYKRVGSSNHLMSVAEISDLFMRSMQYSWDSYPYPNGTHKDLNLQSVKKFITKVNNIGRFHLSIDPWKH